MKALTQQYALYMHARERQRDREREKEREREKGFEEHRHTCTQ